jgi:hypothetical protein
VKTNKNNIKIILAVCLITFCIQTADIKLGFVKISELILLLLTPFLFRKSINKYFFYFLLFFTFEMILGLIITSTLDFQFIGTSKIKAPYIITLARYLELISCISISIITFKLFKNNANESKRIINYLVDWNVAIAIFFFLIYILVISKTIPIQHSIIVYDDNRLRGFYNEGGPYGLMLSFIFILTFFQENNYKKTIKQFFLFVIISFCAKSKAGILFIVIWIAFLNLNYFKNKFKFLIYPVTILFFIVFYFLFINVSSMYFKEFDRIKKSINERPTDVNLILGRVSGTFIVPKMIVENPLFGIGLGNYPLIRNNFEYRTFFPKPPKKVINSDAHGYGGLVDVIVEMGTMGFLIFMFIVYLLYKDLKRVNKENILLMGFLLMFGFGVQLIFLYPWIFFGIILAYKNRYINEISN